MQSTRTRDHFAVIACNALHPLKVTRVTCHADEPVVHRSLGLYEVY